MLVCAFGFHIYKNKSQHMEQLYDQHSIKGERETVTWPHVLTYNITCNSFWIYAYTVLLKAQGNCAEHKMV